MDFEVLFLEADFLVFLDLVAEVRLLRLALDLVLLAEEALLDLVVFLVDF